MIDGWNIDKKPTKYLVGKWAGEKYLKTKTRLLATDESPRNALAIGGSKYILNLKSMNLNRCI